MDAPLDGSASAVTYVGLPVSSGGAHALGRLSRRAAYARTLSFLQVCTEPDGPPEHSFAVLDVPDVQPDPRYERELARRFGQYAILPPERVEEALGFLDEIHPQPVNRWGMAPVWFTLSCQVRILDPETGLPLPGQDPLRYRGVEYTWGMRLGTSHLRLILHNRAELAIDLCLPDVDEAALQRIVPWLQEHLPCTLSPKQWRTWTPTKTGSFTSRRLSAPGT